MHLPKAPIPRPHYIALLTLIILAACSFQQDLDVERLIREDKALIVNGAADVMITRETPTSLIRIDTIPGELVVPAGEIAAITALAYDQQGHQLLDVYFRWSVNEPTVGNISRSGIFRAGFNQGIFTDALVVEATDNRTGTSIRKATRVTIVEPGHERIPTAIRVFPTEAKIDPGQSLRFLAYAVDMNGVMVPATKLTWELSTSRAGTLSPDGRFTAGKIKGSFFDAIQVTVPNLTTEASEAISATVNIVISDPDERAIEPWVSIIPRVITLIPGQEVRFIAAAIDPKGDPIAPLETQWKLRERGAGTFTTDGYYRADGPPGIYPDLVRAYITAPEYEGGFATRASATVIIAETIDISNQTSQLAHTAIFPEKVVLSPGESVNLYLVSTDERGHHIKDSDTTWALSQQNLGQITEVGKLTASNKSGIYPDAIIGEATVQTAAGLVVNRVYATLIVRGPLDHVIISPSHTEVGPKGRIRFTAVAYDKNDIIIPNVLFRWRVTDATTGNINRIGLFTAGERIGDYPRLVRVEAIQILPEY